MEYFRIINSKSTEQGIQEQITLDNLDKITTDLFVLGELNDTEVNIGGIWGEFTLSRHTIKGGIRFALIECPNALTWTITTGYAPDPKSIIIHLTINRQEHNKDFIEEITEFLDDMCVNLKHFFNTKK